MKILKKEVIIAFIIGVLITSGITVYAYSYFASDISYTKPGTETAISVEEALNELYNKKTIPVLLWTNPNPKSAFSPQTVSLDLNNYSYVILDCRCDASNDGSMQKSIIKIGESSNVASKTANSDHVTIYREVSTSNTGITYGIGKWHHGGNNYSTNGTAIPYHIWGIK